MEFISLQAQNFCTLGDITLPLNQTGLVLVTGINKDAPKANNNGSGKSSIFDAICWCLWGETTRGLSGDEVVNLAVGKDCKVALTFEDEGNTYVISRHRKDSRISKPNDIIIMCNGQPLATKSSMKSMQEVIDRIVGFDFHTFCAMMPGTGVKATHMTDIQIKALLESLLHTEHLSVAYDAARTRAKELDNQISTYALDSKRLQNELRMVDDELEKLKSLQDSFEHTKQQEVQQHEERLKTLQAEIDDIEAQLGELDNLKVEIATFTAELEQLQEQKTALQAAENRRIDASNNKMQALISKEKVIQNQIYTLTIDLQNIAALGPSCDSCKQDIPSDHKDSILQDRQTQLTKLTSDLANVEADIKTVNDEHIHARSAFIEDKKSIESMITIKDNAQQVLRLRMSELVTQQRLKARAEEEKKRTEIALAAVKAKTADFESLISGKLDRKEEILNSIHNLNESTASLESEKKLCDFWVNGFSPAGLRSFMLDYVTPILNDRAEFYSNLLTGDEMEIKFSTKTQLKNGETRDKFQIQVKQKHGADLYKGTSTGEKARADLVISMTLGDLAAFRTAKQLPWRFLDEPFESIDDAGIDAIVRLLNDQKERYKTVFVVTHKSSLKQLLSTQQITVIKENGISRVET